MVSRNIGLVIDQMLAIPELPEQVTSELNNLANRFRYMAPEQLNECWVPLAQICNAAVAEKPPEKMMPWEKTLIEILICKKL